MAKNILIASLIDFNLG